MHQKKFSIHIFEIMNEKKGRKKKKYEQKKHSYRKTDVVLLKNLQFFKILFDNFTQLFFNILYNWRGWAVIYYYYL